MKNLKILILVLFLGNLCSAQVASDRLGYMNSTEIVPANGLQIEGGQMLNKDVDYASPLLRNSTKLMLRQGLSDIHEVRIGFHRENKESDLAYNFEWLSLGVKLKVATYEKLHIAAIATWGFDLRTLQNPRGPDYYLQLSVPAEYYFTEKVRIRSEIRFNHAYEQSDFNVGMATNFGENIILEGGLVNNLFLVKRGDNGDKPQWHEFSYTNVALQANIGEIVALNLSIMLPLFTGAGQLDSSDGFIIKGGLSIHIPHNPWRKNKVKIEPEGY